MQIYKGASMSVNAVRSPTLIAIFIMSNKSNYKLKVITAMDYLR